MGWRQTTHFPVTPEAHSRGQDVGLGKMIARCYPCQGGCSEREGARQPRATSWAILEGEGSAGSVPDPLIRPLTKHRQRDGGEELGQPRGEPKPHAQQPRQVCHSPRSRLGGGDMLEDTATNSNKTLQSFCLAGPSHRLDPNSNGTLPRTLPEGSSFSQPLSHNYPALFSFLFLKTLFLIFTRFVFLIAPITLKLSYIFP